MRRLGKKRWGIGFAIALLGAVGLAWWVPRASTPSPPRALEVNGRIEGDQALIGATVGGRIVGLSVRQGDQLGAGDLIAELASEQARARLERAEHLLHAVREQLVEAEARAMGARREAEAAEVAVLLAEQESEARVGEAEAALAAAAARLAAAERRAEEAVLAVSLAERESDARIGEAEAALGAARAGLRRAAADLEKAAKDHVRYEALFARELIAAQQVDQTRTAEAVAREVVEAAREQVGRAEELLELARASRLGVRLRRKQAETARARVAAEAGQADQARERLGLAKTSRVAVGLRGKEAQAASERARQARAAADAIQARIQAAEAGVALARADVRDTHVVAPFAGTVLKKLVEPGEVVAAGTPLVTLLDLSRLYAKVYVAERDLGKIKVGDPARVYVDAFARRHFEATVSEVSQEAEFTPRDIHMKEERVRLVFAVKLAIRNPEGVLKPGMPADARIRWAPDAAWGDGLG